MNCCICGKPIKNFGNNPYPYVRVENAKCCDNCHIIHVVPLNLELQKQNRDPDLYIENGLEPFWKNVEAYKNFPEIKPAPFNILFKDKDYNIVQLHSIEPLNDLSDIIGFVGSVSWIKNELEPLDGDSYYPEMLVYGYKKTDGILDILVKDW